MEFVVQSSRSAARRTVRGGFCREDGPGGQRSRPGLQFLDLLRYFRRELLSVRAVSWGIWLAQSAWHRQADVPSVRAVAQAWKRTAVGRRPASDGERLGHA